MIYLQYIVKRLFVNRIILIGSYLVNIFLSFVFALDQSSLIIRSGTYTSFVTFQESCLKLNVCGYQAMANSRKSQGVESD